MIMKVLPLLFTDARTSYSGLSLQKAENPAQNTPTITVVDTNLETGEVRTFQPEILSCENTTAPFDFNGPEGIEVEVYIPLDHGIQPHDSNSSTKTEAGVTATVAASYSPTKADGSFTWYSFSGSWNPNQSYNNISNRSCGAVEYFGGKSASYKPASNSFAYTLNWSCIRLIGQNPGVWSEATVTPASMGSARHVLEMYMEF